VSKLNFDFKKTLAVVAAFFKNAAVKISDASKKFSSSGYSFPIKLVAFSLAAVFILSGFSTASLGNVAVEAADFSPAIIFAEDLPQESSDAVPIDIVLAAGETVAQAEKPSISILSYSPELETTEEAPFVLVNEAPKKKNATPYNIDSSGISPQTPIYQARNGAIGWINIPGTSINNAVMQSTNNDYYLYRTESGAYSSYGCYFADYECKFGSRSALSPNTVIYGHHIDTGVGDAPNNIKFGQLFKYKDYSFASSHPYIYFSTASEKMTWQVFAVFYVNLATDRQVNLVRNIDPASLANFGKSRSIFNFNVPVSSSDKILTLYTCSYRDGTFRSGRSANIRFIVMAKLI